MTTIDPNAVKTHFLELGGQLAEMCSFNRSLGQIYGFLYMSPEPISLEDIAKGCRMSKGNASIHLRTLEHWGAVHQTGKSGTRKDYYSANTNIRELAMKRLQEGLNRRLDLAGQRIKTIHEDPALALHLTGPEGSLWKTRLEELESMIHETQSGFALLPKLFKLKKFLPL